MSLDVYLKLPGATTQSTEPRIFIREDGRTKQISRKEWDDLFPGREPVTTCSERDECVFEWNITHNLGKMAKEAGVYQHLWRPDELKITRAAYLVTPLRAGLIALRADPKRFKRFNPENGWGNYDGLVEFVEAYLNACEQWPDAEITVSR